MYVHELLLWEGERKEREREVAFGAMTDLEIG